MGFLTDISHIWVGHYTDKKAMTGCTAIIFPQGAVAGVDVRGSAPGTRETDLLRGYNVVDRINAVMLSGGSAYGLDTASGAMKYLEDHGLGLHAGPGVVHIVPAAVIFDMTSWRPDTRPGASEGYAACMNATDSPFACGNVGAGTGATIGKAYGMEHCMRGGLGTACISLENGVKVGALVVVNALGDVYDPADGHIVAGARINGDFKPLMDAVVDPGISFSNTTIGVIATNAKLTREEANKMASMAHDGLAMTVRPVHTMMDGDTFFGAATCEVEEYDFISILIAAVKVTSKAILNAVEQEGAKA